jgi:hypothetical protein
MHMVDTLQIGRRLTHKRKERRLLSRAVQQIATPAPLPPPLSPGQSRQAPAPGYAATVALFRQWEEEAARMTPEEIAADDAVSEGLLENVEKYPLSLRIPDLSDHD